MHVKKVFRYVLGWFAEIVFLFLLRWSGGNNYPVFNTLNHALIMFEAH